MISDAVKRTKERLVKVKRQRSTQRRQRERRETFNISLVGYTNAGKSTLFNRMTGSRAALVAHWRRRIQNSVRRLERPQGRLRAGQ